MYELPSMDDVEKVVIDPSVIRGESNPLLIYHSVGMQAGSGGLILVDGAVHTTSPPHGVTWARPAGQARPER